MENVMNAENKTLNLSGVQTAKIYKILKKAGGIGSDVGCSPGGSDERLEMLTRHSEAYDISRSLNEHINTATLLSRDIREDDLAIEWPDSCSITINAISEELEINNSNLR
ncbi:4882_t:CDS:2 [Diversispora eburnea]|uniref:4882_t:CDS:1 n=1 Tax=Diversispora eburnea TaxID=1213867 RepID=A0A9N9FLI2_9GLOM|nr:4882_t:CDS:2 [Diversispora eburnea]